jgi:hypothetical protein
MCSNKFAMTQEKVTMMYFKAFFCHMHRGTGTDKKERKEERKTCVRIKLCSAICQNELRKTKKTRSQNS